MNNGIPAILVRRLEMQRGSYQRNDLQLGFTLQQRQPHRNTAYKCAPTAWPALVSFRTDRNF
jgi:hypothetical protein